MDDARKKISKGVLEMKFMQKTKQRLERNEKKKLEEDLKKESFVEEAEIKCEPTFEFNTDITELEKLRFGRMSFKGFNEDVEKLMKHYERIRNGEDSEESEDEEVDVQDKDMAAALGSGGVADSIRKKFASKGERMLLMDKQAKGKLNFDPASVRKRCVDKSWAEASSTSKFLKPNEDD